jgi:hypothetical protein
MDLFSLLFLISIVFILVGFKFAIQDCKEAIENPCQFCEDAGCFENYFFLNASVRQSAEVVIPSFEGQDPVLE